MDRARCENCAAFMPPGERNEALCQAAFGGPRVLHESWLASDVTPAWCPQHGTNVVPLPLSWEARVIRLLRELSGALPMSIAVIGCQEDARRLVAEYERRRDGVT